MVDKSTAVIVERWMKYLWNFGATSVDIDGQATTVPDVFNAWKDDRRIQIHLAKKFLSICYTKQIGGTQGLLILFHELDGSHKHRMINWVDDNYDGFGKKGGNDE